MKEESEKPGLKSNIQKMKIMAPCPITLWQIDGEKMETVTNVIFFSSEITVDGDCSHEIKRGLLVEKKSYDQTRHCIKRKRHYFTNKGPYVKAKFSQQSSCMHGRVDHKES